MMVSMERARAYTIIRLLRRLGEVLEAVRFRWMGQPMTIPFQVPLSFRGPRVSDVSRVVHKVLTNVSNPPSDQFVVNGDERSFRHRLCTVETDPAIVDGIHRGGRYSVRCQSRRGRQSFQLGQQF